jgi:acetyl-CoA synthetase
MATPDDRLPIPADFAARAHYDSARLAQARATFERDPDTWWRSLAERLDWSRFPTEIEDVDFDAERFRIRWYGDGELNVAANCLDRQLATNGDKAAILFEPDDPKEPAQRISYRELHARVCRLANALQNLGVKRGDRITIYLPMIPEAAVAMLACARIGAVHSVVFGGFAPHAVADRIADCGSTLVITADEARRGGKRHHRRSLGDAGHNDRLDGAGGAQHRRRGAHADAARPLV